MLAVSRLAKTQQADQKVLINCKLITPLVLVSHADQYMFLSFSQFRTFSTIAPKRYVVHEKFLDMQR